MQTYKYKKKNIATSELEKFNQSSAGEPSFIHGLDPTKTESKTF